MHALAKKYAAALGLRKTIVVIVAAVFVAAAATGWETMAKPGSSPEVVVGGGHYTLQPAW
jgi:hypothetical protein